MIGKTRVSVNNLAIAEIFPRTLVGSVLINLALQWIRLILAENLTTSSPPLTSVIENCYHKQIPKTEILKLKPR